jgi:hypothetical protein
MWQPFSRPHGRRPRPSHGGRQKLRRPPVPTGPLTQRTGECVRHKLPTGLGQMSSRSSQEPKELSWNFVAIFFSSRVISFNILIFLTVCDLY